MILLSVFSDDPLDPGHHLSDPGVDPRVLGLGAPDAPHLKLPIEVEDV